ncbi:hypothetical protein HAX54_021369, partial [Datura stramonium]|nr:hypothetical protein [Datura stramonium]
PTVAGVHGEGSVVFWVCEGDGFGEEKRSFSGGSAAMRDGERKGQRGRVVEVVRRCVRKK